MISREVLFAFEHPAIVSAVAHVLGEDGYTVDHACDGYAALSKLQHGRYAVLVVDVDLPGIPGYELVAPAKALARDEERGAGRVVLVSSAFRRTSYKRRPQRLYGADGHLEVHELGATLLRCLHGWHVAPAACAAGPESRNAAAAADGPGNIARRVVGDVVLYRGARLLDARSESEARAMLADELESAREILAPLLKRPSTIDDAFASIMRALGRETEVQS